MKGKSTRVHTPLIILIGMSSGTLTYPNGNSSESEYTIQAVSWSYTKQFNSSSHSDETMSAAQILADLADGGEEQPEPEPEPKPEEYVVFEDQTLEEIDIDMLVSGVQRQAVIKFKPEEECGPEFYRIIKSMWS